MAEEEYQFSVLVDEATTDSPIDAKLKDYHVHTLVGPQEGFETDQLKNFDFTGRLKPGQRGHVQKFSPTTLENEFELFTHHMQKVLLKTETNETRFKVDEIEMNLVIGAEGSISFLGTGGKITGEGSIKLKFVRK